MSQIKEISQNLADLKPMAQNSTPLYMQIALKIRDSISAGRWASAQGLPSERQLVEALSVSRVTARKALHQVAQWGMAIKKQGSGTYVAPRLQQPLSRLSSFTEELQRRGVTAGSIWLERSIGFPSTEEMMALGIGAEVQVARLNRLRTADGVAMAIETCRVTSRFLPDPLQIDTSLYDYLDSRDTPVVRAIQRISATNANKEQARLLEMPVNTAVLFITRLGYGRDNQIIEFTHSYCRPDHYDFVAELTRSAK